jgi:hypothetical protein
MVDERDKTIRQLYMKIDKLKATLKKTTLTRGNSEGERQPGEDSNYF